jgi:hypothetical protein
LEGLRTGSIIIFLRVATLNDASLLVLEFLCPAQGAVSGATAGIAPAPRVTRGWWPWAVSTIHHHFVHAAAESLDRIGEIKGSWLGCDVFGQAK